MSKAAETIAAGIMNTIIDSRLHHILSSRIVYTTNLKLVSINLNKCSSIITLYFIHMYSSLYNT